MKINARMQLITVLLLTAVVASTSACKAVLPPDTPEGSRLNPEEPWLYGGAALTLHSVTEGPVEDELIVQYSVINVGRQGIDFVLRPSNISVADNCGNTYEVLRLQAAEPLERGAFLPPNSRLDFDVMVKALAEGQDCTLLIDVHAASFPTSPAWETFYPVEF